MNALMKSYPSTVGTLVKKAWQNQLPRSMTVLSKQSGEDYKKYEYSKKQKSLGRPVSPHVLIYAFPMAAVTSITNRVTGVALSVGCAGLGFAEMVGGGGTSLWLMQTIGSVDYLPVVMGAKFTVAFPIVYHYLGAIRHFAWDEKPEYLTNEQVEKSSLVLLGSSTLISAGLMFV